MIYRVKGFSGLIRVIQAGIFALLVLGGLSAAERDGAATRRFGIFIGSNNGGRDRVMLRYAVSDAKSLSRVFAGMGGISGGDNILLVEPSVTEINRRLDDLEKIAALARNNSQRTELVFYYSGHSDENGILLNRESYNYRELRERISSVQADMRIVILDSCSSGAITRAKGGVKTQPFLFDSSVSAAGYAFLTSSSFDETSQESDSIESSYFTHSLLAGLRGAADSVGDGRVTLNELYRFAYTETLAKTETSVYGAQHPSYDIQISGSGDVVLTDVKEISAGLVIGDDVSGRVSIRDSSDFLVAELTKAANKTIELGLEPGSYRVTLQRGDNFYRTEITLAENNRVPLGMKDFTMIAAAPGGLRRGDSGAGETDTAGEDAPLYPFNIQPIPGFDVMGHRGGKATNNFLFGLFAGVGHNIRGVGLAPLALVNSGYVSGVQGSLIFNTAGGTLSGVQTSGIFNITRGDIQGIQITGIFNRAGGDIMGIQNAGIFNWAEGEVTGVQMAGILNRAGGFRGIQAGLINVSGEGKGAMIGLVNVSKSPEVFPVGLVNVVEGGISHPAVFVDDMLFTNVSFRSGSRRFYTLLSAGFKGWPDLKRELGSGERFLVSRGGFGLEFSVSKFFIDIDVLGGTIINLDTINLKPDKNKSREHWYDDAENSMTGLAQFRLVGGYKIFSHLGVFCGVSYDYLGQRDKDKSPGIDDFGGVFVGVGKDFGAHVHKLGFFGGIQF